MERANVRCVRYWRARGGAPKTSEWLIRKHEWSGTNPRRENESGSGWLGVRRSESVVDFPLHLTKPMNPIMELKNCDPGAREGRNQRR